MIHSINQSSKKKQNQIRAQAKQPSSLACEAACHTLMPDWSDERQCASKGSLYPASLSYPWFLVVGSYYGLATIGLLSMVTIYYYAQLHTPIVFYHSKGMSLSCPSHVISSSSLDSSDP